MLDDLGDDVQLMAPGGSPSDPPVLVDRVQYSADTPWPVEPGAGTASLIRDPLDAFGNDSTSWMAGIALGTPGRANLGVDTTAPSAPTGMSADVEAGPSVRLTWEASVDAETGVAQYQIIRDGVDLAFTRETSFVDPNATLGTVHVYQIRAINAQAIPSSLSAELPVVILSANAISRFSSQVLVEFSAPVTAETAEVAANYAIDGIQINSATLSDDGRLVTLSTSELPLEQRLDLTVNGLRSQAGDPLAPDFSIQFSYQQGVPGVTVINRAIRRTTVDSLDDVQALLALPEDDSAVDFDVSGIYPNLHFSDDDGHSLQSPFPNPSLFPADEPGGDNNHVLRANGFAVVTEEQAGPWTFAVTLDTPTETVRTSTLIPLGSTWRYLDDGTDQQTAWRFPGFDDSAWQSGQGQFGYGDGDETTILDFGPDPNNKVVTSYFRMEFDVDDLASIESAEGSLIRDDGAAVYINGFEVDRQNLAADAGFQDFALTENGELFENAPVSFPIDRAFLFEGTNTIAIELHQSSASGEDLGFDFALNLARKEAESNDGVRLRLGGADVIVANAGNGSSNRIGTIDLAAGAHPFALDFFEATGGAELSLFAAPGQFSSIGQTDTWQLVGDRSAGGLALETDPEPPISVPWQRLGPGGGGIGLANIRGDVPGGGVPLRHSISMKADQLLSATIAPLDSNATLSVRIRDSFQTLQQLSSASPGEAVVLSDFVAPTSDSFLIEVSSDVATEYVTRAFGNALLESENPGESQNDTVDTAQRLDASRIAVNDGHRFAVVGATDENGAADYFVFNVDQAQPLSVAAEFASNAGAELQLLTSTGDLLATGIVSEVGATISDFPISAAGDYVLRLSASKSRDYALAAMQGIGIEVPTSFAPEFASPISSTSSVVGFLGQTAGAPALPGNDEPVPDIALLVDGDGFTWDVKYNIGVHLQRHGQRLQRRRTVIKLQQFRR